MKNTYELQWDFEHRKNQYNLPSKNLQCRRLDWTFKLLVLKNSDHLLKIENLRSSQEKLHLFFTSFRIKSGSRYIYFFNFLFWDFGIV